ncbi:MAG: SMP-30/gluconolactonase/LRE family protein [Pseudolabrys sp.]|nr:SMP-30/gluconolactonase/LRE family protein [Pseudolabrys sp.]
MGNDTNAGGWNPSLRYPDPTIEALDPRFKKYHLPLSSVEQLFTGTRWGEGPVWFGDLRCVIWSDIPNNRMLKWDEESGETTVFRKPSNNCNGNTRDREGRLITCEHLTRRVTRTEIDGSIRVIADKFEGKRLNSPNDVVVKSDGTIWFTDPQFGILSNYEGETAEPELPMYVFRFDPKSGKLNVVADGIKAPNGLAFSPDEKKLYIVESRAEPRTILVCDVAPSGDKISNRKVLIDSGPHGTPDGFRVDIDGNLWCGWGMTAELDGVRMFSPQGEPLGHIHLPERAANLCFGGRHRNRLFIAAAHSLYSLYVNTQGVKGG